MTAIETNENIERHPTLNPDVTKAKHGIVKIMIHKDTLAGLHHQLELLAGLVALNLRRNTNLLTLNRQMEPSVILLSAAIWRANLSLSAPLLIKYLTSIPKSLARDSQLFRTCAVSPLTQSEKSLRQNPRMAHEWPAHAHWPATSMSRNESCPDAYCPTILSRYNSINFIVVSSKLSD